MLWNSVPTLLRVQLKTSMVYFLGNDLGHLAYGLSGSNSQAAIHVTDAISAFTIVLSAKLLLTLEVAVLATEAKGIFGLVLVNVSANKKQFRSATPNQSYHCFALSSL